jgi:hypothetical protein
MGMSEFHNDRVTRLGWHEAGHAIVAEGLGVRVKNAALVHFCDAGHVNFEGGYIEPTSDRAISIAGLLAEAMAGLAFVNPVEQEADNQDLPLWYRNLPDQRAELWDQVHVLQDDVDCAQRILTRHWPAVAVTAFLLKDRQSHALTGDQVRAIIHDPHNAYDLVWPNEHVRNFLSRHKVPPVGASAARHQATHHLLTGLWELRQQRGLSNDWQPPKPKPAVTVTGANTISNRPSRGSYYGARRLPYETRDGAITSVR